MHDIILGVRPPRVDTKATFSHTAWYLVSTEPYRLLEPVMWFLFLAGRAAELVVIRGNTEPKTYINPRMRQPCFGSRDVS